MITLMKNPSVYRYYVLCACATCVFTFLCWYIQYNLTATGRKWEQPHVNFRQRPLLKWHRSGEVCAINLLCPRQHRFAQNTKTKRREGKLYVVSLCFLDQLPGFLERNSTFSSANWQHEQTWISSFNPSQMSGFASHSCHVP